MTERQPNTELFSAPPPICAIGASAGGVSALQEFFGAIKDELGLAYVVVIHLAPDRPSRLGSILAGRTAMPVEHVERASKIRSNCVYVISPGHELVVEGDNLMARPLTEPRSRRAPIDVFFRSVAAAGGDAMAVVLSGSGSDGALGIRAVKEAGGVIFAQDPDEAEYPEMPQSAIATGLVDFIAPIPALVQRIAEVTRSKKALNQLHESEADEGFRKISRLLHARTGYDFSHYGRTTFMRRVARRMQVSRHDSLGSYAHYLGTKSDEMRELVADLMVSFMRFFHDDAAFRTLSKRAVEPVFKKPGKDASVRVWVVGCATGEEAYSIAMLLLEQAARSRFHGSIQVFASDVDEKSLAAAREGRYAKSIAVDVSQERLRRFFVEDGDHYRIIKEVRDRVLFTRHSVFTDPPFIRIDLVVCRNLLIHLDQEQQQQLYALLHYALNPGGYLFLGTADRADAAPELFRPIDRGVRLFQAKATQERVVPALTAFTSVVPRAFPHGGRPQRVDSEATLSKVHLSALEHRSPPSALIDADGRVLHLSPNAGRFIRPSEGPLRAELLQLVRPELRAELKLALRRAFEHNEATLTLPITVETEGKQGRRIMAYVGLTEADDGAPSRAIVLFLDAGAAAPVEEAGMASAWAPEEHRRLAEEVVTLQERLDASEKQHAEALEELTAANEELQSINEEYRSTSEELETSKEELQSSNEELKTINVELRAEIDNIATSRSDLQNLIAATEIGALFLDQDLQIRFFTPTVANYFNITHGDIGRTITDFTNRLRYENIRNDATNVLKNLIPVETEVKTLDERWLMVRMRPYRLREHLIGGVVLTFTDVTELKQVEQSLATELSAMARLQQLSTRIVESTELEPALLLVLDAAMELLGADLGHIQLYDSQSGRLHLATQRGFDERLLDRFRDYLPDADISANWAPGRAVLQRRQILIEDIEKEPGFRRYLEWSAVAGFRAVQSTPLVAAGGTLVGVLSTHFRAPRRFSPHDLRLIDICARQASDSIKAYRLQESLRKSENRLRQVLETETIGVQFVDKDGTIIDVNNAFVQMLGYSRAEVDARALTWRKLTPPEWIALSEEQFYKLERSGLIGPYEKEYLRKDGSRCWILITGRKLEDGTTAEYCINISARKRAEQERELLARELSHRVKNTLAVVEALASQTTGNTVEEFREKFAGRLHALAEAHTMLLDSDWRSVELEALIEQALLPYHVEEGQRARIAGTPVTVTPKQALGLRLIVHELATNAVKYGALSTEKGKLDVSWRTARTDGGQRQVRLVWKERGGPAVNAPDQTGFGARLIKSACEYDLEGEARLDYAPKGLSCEITFPTASHTTA
jgi:two-component system, chemotaxis family, CheB/CheR fusion protein